MEIENIEVYDVQGSTDKQEFANAILILAETKENEFSSIIDFKVGNVNARNIKITALPNELNKSWIRSFIGEIYDESESLKIDYDANDLCKKIKTRSDEIIRDFQKNNDDFTEFYLTMEI